MYCKYYKFDNFTIFSVYKGTGAFGIEIGQSRVSGYNQEFCH